MTEQAQLVEKMLFDYQEELLHIMTHGQRPLERLEDICVQGSLFYGISPRLCDDQEVVTIDNLVKLQKYCLSLWEEYPDSLYFDIVERVCFLLNENVPMEQVMSFTLNQLEERMDAFIQLRRDRK